MKPFPLASLAVTVWLATAATGAHAHGLAKCDSGPQSGWKPKETLEKQLVERGWKIRRIRVDEGCYEVYGTDEHGKRVEAYFHPVTLASVPTKSRKD